MSSPPSSSSSPSLQHNGHLSKMGGVPCPATPTRYTAPVHIDVGGVIYTSSLDTLTKAFYLLENSSPWHLFPESRLARMFNGNIPIVLDSLKQHYFIDRDGKLFRYILNYLRSSRLIVPDNFDELEQLYDEARFYDLRHMIGEIEIIRKSRNIKQEKPEAKSFTSESSEFSDCIAVSVSPDLGERISLSAERYLIQEVFPELTSALQDSRNSGFNLDNRYVIRFPLNGFCKLNSIQVFQRLLNNTFKMIAATGGGVEGQQFSEYLFIRKNCRSI